MAVEKQPPAPTVAASLAAALLEVAFPQGETSAGRFAEALSLKPVDPPAVKPVELRAAAGSQVPAGLRLICPALNPCQPHPHEVDCHASLTCNVRRPVVANKKLPVMLHFHMLGA